MLAAAIALVPILTAGAAPAPEAIPLDPSGTILAWLVAGPFPEGGPRFGPNLAALREPPAEGSRLADRTWERAYAGAGGLVDLEARFRTDHAVAYATCLLESDRDGRGALSVGSDDAIRIWYAGRLVHEHRGRRGWKAGEDRAPIELRRGAHLLVVEIGELVGDWGFSVAVEAPEGATVGTRLSLREPLPSRLVEVEASPTGFLEGPEDDLRGLAFLRVRYLGLEKKARIRVRVGGEAGPWQEREIAPGERTYEVDLPVVSEARDAEIEVRAGPDAARRPIRLRPQRRWEVYIVQHTHTDIGYTTDQDDIYREHMRFIDEALHWVRATEAYPPEARFRWVCEVSWGAELYLRNRPAQALEALARAVRAGRIEFTALPLNMTDLATEECVIRGLRAAARLRRRFGAPVVSAMQDDVNGFPWALPRLLSACGVRYFANGINETRSRVPFPIPTAFYWESPDGSRLLTWRGPHYLTGNFLGLTGSVETARKGLARYLANLESKDYPHRVLILTVGGVLTDNAPPGGRICDIVRAWNERWAYPRLHLATLAEAFRALEADARGRLPHLRKAWPDWWADGNGSAAREVALVRRAQERLAAADGLLSITGLALGPRGAAFRRRLGEAYDAALLFDEHTWGASSSISDPDGLREKNQWGFKSAYASRAGLDAAELLDAALAGLVWRIPTGGEPAIAVFNPLPWERSGLVEGRLRATFFGDEPLQLVDAATGEPVPMQSAGRSGLWIRYLFEAKGVPSMGYRIYRVQTRGMPRVESPFTFGPDSIDNGLVRVEVDPETGAIRSIADRAVGGDIAAVAGDGVPHGFGQYVYEEIRKAPARGFLWPRGREVPFVRRTLKGVRVTKGAAGPLAASLVVAGAIEEDHTVRLEIELRRADPTVHLTYRVRKPATRRAEAVYIAFPFADPLEELRLEVVGGVARPGIDQIPGSASDWHSAQTWVRAKGADRGAVWVTVDAPLVQFGEINTGKYQEIARVPRPTLYSWPMNNYWFTNFPAEQGGEFVLRYAVRAHRGAGSDALASRIARQITVPLRPVFLPPGRGGDLPPARASFLSVEPDGTALVGIKPAADGKGAILRLREPDGEARTVRVRLAPPLRAERAERTSPIEEGGAPIPVRHGAFEVRLGPWGAADVRVVPFAP